MRRHTSARGAASAQLVNDRYRLLARIGTGRLGPVYEANDERSSFSGEEARVAVQPIDPKLITVRRFVGDFERGVKTLQGISHSNIVRLLDAGRDKGSYFLVTEAPDGASLRYVLDDVGKLPLEEAAAVTRSVGDALQYLHVKTIVHGNLKPENVFVTFDFEVKLLDIVPPGWPAAGRDQPDERNDVYGLACLAYEMLAGKHPFNENTPDEAHHAGLSPAPIGLLSSRQWRALAAGLELEPERRTPTVARFLDDFGIADTEQLRALITDDAESTALVAPDLEPVPHAAPAPEPVPLPAAYASAPESVLIPTYAYALRPKRPEGARVRFFLLLLLALGVLAYANRERLQEVKDALAATVDSWVADVPDPNAGIEAATPPESRAAEIEAPAAATPPAAVPLTDFAVQKPPVAAPHPPQVGFARPVVTVKESEVAVRLIIRRSGDLSQGASIAWWPQDGSATADRDFADLGVRVEQFAAGEAARTVFVPLINDADWEPTESFNVYLGRSTRGRRTPEPQAGLRVDIVDDD